MEKNAWKTVFGILLILAGAFGGYIVGGETVPPETITTEGKTITQTVEKEVVKEVPATSIKVGDILYDADKISRLLEVSNSPEVSFVALRNKALRDMEDEVDQVRECNEVNYRKNEIDIEDYDSEISIESEDDNEYSVIFRDVELEYDNQCTRMFSEVIVSYDRDDVDVEFDE